MAAQTRPWNLCNLSRIKIRGADRSAYSGRGGAAGSVMKHLAKWSLCLATLAACGESAATIDGGMDAATNDATTNDATTNDGAPQEGGGGDVATDAIGPPIHPPSSITYADGDPTKGITAGMVTIVKATDESDVTSYKLYWGLATSSDGGLDAGAPTKLSLIVDLPKTGSNLTYALNADIPSGASYLIAVSSNALGEMADGPATAPVDNYVIWADLGTTVEPGFDAGVGISQPSVAIDTVNHKLIVAAQGQGKRVALYLCDLSGSACLYQYVDTSSTGIPLYPRPIVDATNKNLLVAAQFASYVTVYRCDLDGTNCGLPTAFTGGANPNHSTATLNANGDKLYVAYEESGGTLDLFRCDTATGGLANCSARNPVLASALKPAIAAANGTVFVSVNDPSNNNKPGLLVCDETQWPTCTYKDVSAGAPDNVTAGSSYPELSTAFDSTNGKVLTVVHDNSLSGHPGLFRCDATGLNCTHGDLSGMTLDAGADSGFCPHALVDDDAGRLYVATQDGSNNQKPAVFHCDVNGTNCTRVDISASQGAGSAYELSAVLDPYNKRIVVVTTDQSNGGKPSFFSLGLW